MLLHQNNMRLKYHKIENIKQKPVGKTLKHHGKPLVILDKNDEISLEDVFNFYIGFPLHSKKRIAAAHRLFGKLTQTKSDITQSSVALPIKAGFNKTRSIVVIKGN